MNSNIQQPLLNRASVINDPPQPDVGDLPTQSLPTESVPQPQHVPNLTFPHNSSGGSAARIEEERMRGHLALRQGTASPAPLSFSSLFSRKTVSFLFRVVILLALSSAIFLIKNQTQYQGHGAGSGNLYWSSDFETGNLSQFGGIHTGMPSWGNSSATVVSQGGTINGLNNDGPWFAPAPHNGKYAVGLLVDGPSSDTASAGGQRAELTSGYYDTVNTERWYGLSVYIPSTPNKDSNGNTQGYNNALWETGWGTSLNLKMSTSNDPTGDSSSFQIADGANPQNGWSSAWYHIAPILYDQWVNFTIHVYWAADATGYFEVYENGQLVTLKGLSDPSFSGTRAYGPTYGVASQMVSEFDWYRSNAANYPNLLYLDDLKIGDTYAVVQPASTSTSTPTTVMTPTMTPTPPVTNTPTPSPIPISRVSLPPTVTILSPLNGSTVSRHSNVTITASASDNAGVTKVTYSINGSLLCTSTTSPYSCSWSIPGKPNATYTITATAYDAAGYTGTNSVSVTAK